MDDVGPTLIAGREGAEAVETAEGGAPPATGVLKVVRSRMLAAGNIHSRKPVIRMELRLDGDHPGSYPPEWWRGVTRQLPNLRAEVWDFPGFSVLSHLTEPVPAAAAVEFLGILLQRSTGWPVGFMASLSTLGRDGPERDERPVAIFTTRHRGTGLRAARIAVEALERLENSPAEAHGAILADAFESFRRRTRGDTPSRVVTWLAGRAERRGIGWSSLGDSTWLRLGRGRHAQIVQNFDTGLTSCVAKGLARRKHLTRQVLADAGFPVAMQEVVRSTASAIDAAQEIGFPVVVKPMDGSEGRAVSVGLTTEAEVAQAYALAREISSAALVESLIPGVAFRLSVIGGRFFAAAERHPPRVRGDGARTVNELIAEENRNPERVRSNRASMEPIVLDDDMLATLDEQGLSLDAVPEAGRWVLLRRVPNAPYGDKTDVTDITHPTIRAMAERVAALVGLSVCGIDFVATDITRPWSETGGAICEVNNRPDLGLHTLVNGGTSRDGADAVLDMLFPKGRRSSFPIVAVLRDREDGDVEGLLRAAWEGRGYRVGVASAVEDGAEAREYPQTWYRDRLRALDLDTDLDLAIVALSPRQFVDWGLGYDRVDLAVVQAGEGGSTARRARRALERVARGRAVALDDPDLGQRSYESVELGRKLRAARPLVRPAPAAPPETRADAAPTFPAGAEGSGLLHGADAPGLLHGAEGSGPLHAGADAPAVPHAAAPSALPRRRRPALLALRDEGVSRPRSGPLQSREPRLLGAGNPYARRPVVVLPIAHGAGAVMPALMAQTLASILPPLSDKVPEFGGWRRITAATGPVPLSAVVEVLAVAVQRHIGWPVRFCAWRAEAGQAWPAPQGEPALETGAAAGAGTGAGGMAGRAGGSVESGTGAAGSTASSTAGNAAAGNVGAGDTADNAGIGDTGAGDTAAGDGFAVFHPATPATPAAGIGVGSTPGSMAAGMAGRVTASAGAASTAAGDAFAVFEAATPATGIGAAGIALSLASALLDGKSPAELQAIFLEETSALQQATGKERPHADALEIAREATRAGIAWAVVEGTNFLRLGSGRRAHVMSGSETTNTSLIGRRLAQSRAATSGILASAGLPVPLQRLVRSEAEALEAADDVGFPLAIKPATGSKERAVTTGIARDAGILPALHRALAISPEAVVESFAPGDEYRLLVVGGRFAAAARRRPAQVIGDGTSSIRALIARENARPERDRRLASRPGALVPLALDNEAVALLGEQGLTPESVPAPDRVVTLRRQPSGAYGGDTVDATDAVHPDIRRMAERAAAVLGIDVCGIDVVTTDIARPAGETGGVICDVSTRPSLRLHYGVSEGKAQGVAGAVLDMLFRDGAPSRCPVVVLVGTDEETAALRRSAERAAARAGRTLGVVSGDGGDDLAPETRRLKDASAIAWDKEVDAVLIHATPADLAERGLGIERIDLAIMPAEDAGQGGGDPASEAARRALARLSGNRILPPGDPAARRRVLSALGHAGRTTKPAPVTGKTAAEKAAKPAPDKPATRATPEAQPAPAPAPVLASVPATVAGLPVDLSPDSAGDLTADGLPPVLPVEVTDDPADLPAASLPPASEPLRPRTANAAFLMVGDIGFGENYMHLPRAAGLLRLLDEHGYRHSLARLEGLLSSADMVIGNLESPLSSRPDSALRGRKKYLGWSHPERTVEALVQAGIHAVSLANNHALDCGRAGLDATIARLAAAGIESFGAGRDLGAAERPFIRRFIVGGQERSLVVFAGFEHRDRYQDRYRWYARPEAPGVNRLAAERIGERIAALRASLPAPFFVAYPHWGADYSEVNDSQREEAARLIAAGVDLVVGHGTHAAQTVEMIAGRPVVFGLGNFVWNSPGRYGKFGAQPYSLAAALVFPGKRGGGGTALRLYPIVTDNIVTKFQNRPVTKEEFGQAITALTRGLRLPAKRRTDKAGRCLELRLEGPQAATGPVLAVPG